MMGLSKVLQNLFGDYNGVPMGASMQVVKNWIEQLPLLDYRKSAVMLQSALDELQKQKLSAKLQYARLSVLLSPIERVSNAFLQDYINDASLNVVLRQAQLFYARHLHQGFAEACSALLSSSKLQKSPTLYLQTAVLGLQAYARVMLRSYQLSLPIPKHVWQRCYQIYFRLEQFDLLKSTSHIPIDGGHWGAESGESLFKQMVLLAISNPYQMNALQIEHFSHYIRDWEEYIEILGQKTDHTVFSYSLSQDKPPIYCDLLEQQGDQDRLHFIDVTALVRYIHDNFVSEFAASTLPSEAYLSRDFFRQLLKVWQEMAKRQYERHRAQGSCNLLTGVSLIHSDLLQAVLRQHGDQLKTPENSSLAVQEDLCRIEQNGDEWQTIYQHYRSHLQPEPASMDRSHWTVVDKSANGYCLSSSETKQTSSLLNAGQLVCLIDDGGAHQVCIIRWVRANDTGQTFLGLQVVSSSVQAVFVQNQKQKSLGYRIPALLAKENRAPFPQGDLLLTYSLPYHEGDQLTLICGEEEATIVLDKWLERSPYFQLYPIRKD